MPTQATSMALEQPPRVLCFIYSCRLAYQKVDAIFGLNYYHSVVMGFASLNPSYMLCAPLMGQKVSMPGIEPLHLVTEGFQDAVAA